MDRKYSLEEYFEFEKRSEEKLEFLNGKVWSVSGASPEHELVVVNVCAHLRAVLRDRKCSVFSSGLKIKVPGFLPYRYADLSGYCGEGIFETMGGLDVLTNPQMIIEVLSPSTEAFDRGEKFTYYKSIPSLTEYLLIATMRPHLTQFVKQDENEWIQREAVGLEEKLTLAITNTEILLSEIYLDVTFPDPLENLLLYDR